jgi:site-specific DNA-cytosine methylase
MKEEESNDSKKNFKVFSMFSGIGGFDEAFRREGHEVIGHSEIDKYADQIYSRHFTNRNYGDCTRIIPEDLPEFDVICGGFPCQAFSIAGKRRGFEDTRGTLFFEIARIVKVKRPKYLLLENVKGLLNHKNGKPWDNHAENLEWVTHSENSQHSFSTGFQNAIQIEKIEIDFNETQITESLIKFINSSEEKDYSPMRLIQ